MKKFLLTASVVLMGVGMAVADMYKHPSANTKQPASIYYGGVKYATGAFTVSINTVTVYGTQYSTENAGFVLYGVLFSSGICGTDFVDVFDSTSIATVAQLAASEGTNASLGQTTRFRIYNISGSTGTSTAGAAGNFCSGFSGPDFPIRVDKGMWFRPSAMYNSLNLLYWREEE